MKNNQIKSVLLLLFSFCSILLSAQAPKSIDLMEEGEFQRRDLSLENSRIVINTYNFDADPKTITPVVYSNSPALPLNVAYLSTENEFAGNRFGREIKELLLFFVKTASGYKEADIYETQWTPHALPFKARYGALNLNGYDLFYDENTLIRNISLDKEGDCLIAGKVVGKCSVSKNSIVIEHPNFNYAISGNYSFGKVVYYKTYEDLKSSINPLSNSKEASYWAVELKDKQNITIATSYSLKTISVKTLTQWAGKALANKDAHSIYLQREEEWDNYLANLPHPLNFSLEVINPKGVSAKQIRDTYYKAWVFLAQSVLCPDEKLFPYYQFVTGKPSLWDHGHKNAPFSAAWESFVGMQLFGYINPDISWSALKGLLSLVDEEGMLGGESLPSKKAESAWILYQLSDDLKSLKEVYPALMRYLDWRIANPRWIYLDLTPENEKDIEFVVAALIDIECMMKIAEVLGYEEDVTSWNNKYIRLFNECLSWFWKTPQSLPVQHINQFDKRDTFPIQITTALYLKELAGDHYESMLGLFYKYYNPEHPFAGFDATKYPDVNYTIYGLIEKNKTQLAQSLLEANIRDIVLTHSVFAETYRIYEIHEPSGVRPSIFGMASIIDFILMKNNYFYQKGDPHVINLFDSESGITGIKVKDKKIDVSHQEGSGGIIVKGDLLDSSKSISVKSYEITPICE